MKNQEYLFKTGKSKKIKPYNKINNLKHLFLRQYIYLHQELMILKT